MKRPPKNIETRVAVTPAGKFLVPARVGPNRHARHRQPFKYYDQLPHILHVHPRRKREALLVEMRESLTK